MLGMFGSTPELDDTTRIRLKNRIANLLHAQLAILSDPVIQDITGTLNRKAIGYVYGFVNGYLSLRCGLEQIETCMRISSEVLQDLFGRYKNENYDRFLMFNLNEPLVASGMVMGDREVQDYLNSISAMPIGLARMILEGRKLKTEESYVYRR